MRIGIDASPLRVPSGGIRRYTEELIDGLVRLDSPHRYVLYHAPRDRDLFPSKRFGEIERDPLDFRGKRYVDALHLARASRTIDLYHGTNYSVPLFSRIPTVVTVHDLSVQLVPQSHPISRRMKHRLLPTICRRATRIIADSHQTRQDLVRLYELDESKIDVVHLGVSRSFRPVTDEAELSKVRARYRLPSAFILYLGALEPRKNLEALIGAFAILRRAGADSGKALVIAGKGLESYEQKLRAHALESGLMPGRDVHFPGFIEDRDLGALYSSSALFVFPSRYEGFGLPPLEAMACGVPVVLARNSSMTEVYEGTCAMVDADDPKVLADAIHAMLDGPRRREDEASRGLELARSLGWEKACSETLAVYERAVHPDGLRPLA